MGYYFVVYINYDLGVLCCDLGVFIIVIILRFGERLGWDRYDCMWEKVLVCCKMFFGYMLFCILDGCFVWVVIGL